jgi:hypothetical protein
MSVTTKIKSMIAEGKTEEAIALLDNFLKKRDINLHNQTLLLASQFKDAKKKMSLNVADAQADINRINFTLLSICDECKNLEDVELADDGSVLKSNEGIESNTLNKTLIIFGVLILIGLLVVLGIFFYGNR